MIKLVKLDKRHHLYHKKFTHGFKFSSHWNPDCIKVKKLLVDNYGYDFNMWCEYQSQPYVSPVWIGIKDESIATWIFLQM
jgi:hypothetical protein